MGVFLKKILLVLVAFVIGFAPLVAMPMDAVYAEGGEQNENQSDHWITVTLHAGEHGYFGATNIKEKDIVMFEDDTFSDETIPDLDGSDYRFTGWEDAEGNDVDVWTTKVGRNITDLYATYSNRVLVNYSADGGYFNDEYTGRQETTAARYYSAGDQFENLIPLNESEYPMFEGWYTESYGQGTKYTDGMEITIPEDSNTINLHAHWVMNSEGMDVVVPGTDYHMAMDSGKKIYAFTPTKDAYYNIYTINADADHQACIQLYDENSKMLRNYHPAAIPDVYLTYHFEANKTYYIFIFDFMGSYLDTDFRVEEFEPVTITLHANVLEGESAYFDGDPAKTEKQVKMLDGDLIENLMDGQYDTLTIGSDWLAWRGWDSAADGTGGETIVHDGMDFYVQWERNTHLTAYANGGFFKSNESTEKVNTYIPDDAPLTDVFEVPEPNDRSKAFLGWATTPDATEPDIIIGVTLHSQLPDKIYAVYSTKVHITFLANGGHYFIWPDMTEYGMVYPTGKSMPWMTAEPGDETLRHIGYTDQHGNDIYLTDDEREINAYIINNDTVFTAFYGNRVYVDANGGVFPSYGAEVLGILVRTDGGFRSESIYRMAEKPVNESESGKPKYIIGWATEPDATEPDIVEGVTDVTDLYQEQIYAVWADDEYVIKGEEAEFTWTRGSKDGLQIVVHRTGDDSETYDNFTGISVDGEDMARRKDEVYEAEKGSLILTLKAEYLESLADGEHDLIFHFSGVNVGTTFSIVEPEDEDGGDTIPVPSTGDNTAEANGATAGCIILTVVVIAVICRIFWVFSRNFSRKDNCQSY